MLTKIEVKSFRSCRDVTLDGVQEILALIGRNGAGKTNILKAIDWACRFASVNAEVGSPRRPEDYGSVSLTFCLPGGMYRYDLVKKRKRSEKVLENRTEIEEKVHFCTANTSKMLVHRQGEHVELFREIPDQNVSIEIAESIPALLAIMSFLPEDNFFRIMADKLTKFMSSVKYYPLHNYDENVDEAYVMGTAYRTWKAEPKDSNSLRSVMFKLISLKLDRPIIFDELNSLMGTDGLGLVEKIDVEEFSLKLSPDESDPEKSKVFWLEFLQPYSSGKTHFNINDLSFGSKRILFLLVSMLYDKASVFLIEQPEDGVHIGLVDKLLPLFRSYSSNSQYIIATHSTTILNRTTPDEIRFISNSDGLTQARKLTHEELRAAENFLRNDGPLSEFLEMIGDD